MEMTAGVDQRTRAILILKDPRTSTLEAKQHDRHSNGKRRLELRVLSHWLVPALSSSPPLLFLAPSRYEWRLGKRESQSGGDLVGRGGERNDGSLWRLYEGMA